MSKRKQLQFIIILLVLATFSTPASIFAAPLSGATQQASSPPSIEILNSTSDYLDLVIRFPENPLFDNGHGKVFNQDVYSSPSEVGAPDLPVLRRDVSLVLALDYSIEILESKSSTGLLGEGNLPAFIPERPEEIQKCESEDGVCDEKDDEDIILNEEDEIDPPQEDPPQDDPPQEDPPQEDPINPEDNTEEESIENNEHFFPSSPVEMVNIYTIRGQNIGQFEFWPVQYDPINQSVIIYQEINLRVSFHQPDVQMSMTNLANYSSYVFDRLLSDHILNYNQGNQIQTTYEKSNEAILIITPNAFHTTASSLVSLKESQGYPVTLVSLSTTGSTPEAIRSYIHNAYHNWPNPPTYVILIGDVNNGSNSMPAFTGHSSQSVTDLYYGTVDGSDWIPDVFVGRLPARNTTQLTTMINNLAAYNNLTGSESWVNRSAFLASNDANFWQVAEATQNYVIQNHTQPAGYTGTFPSASQPGGDKLYAHTYSAGHSEVINAINNHRALISYTGHGSRVSWGTPHFNQGNIRDINHTGTFSVVTSFACVTGDFNYEESYGETWLLQPNKGAVAFIGSSANSYWGPDDILERAMMDALYSGTRGANNVSAFLFAGLMAVETSRPGTGTAQSRYYWETYNLLGDPSLNMLIGPKETEITPNYRPRFNTSALTLGQEPGKTVNVRIELTNAGLNPDTYTLNLLTNSWTVSLQSLQTIDLKPGESTMLEFSITIPSDAEYGESEQTVLSVISTNDPETPPAKDTATIELRVAKLTFLPLISNP